MGSSYRTGSLGRVLALEPSPMVSLSCCLSLRSDQAELGRVERPSAKGQGNLKVVPCCWRATPGGPNNSVFVCRKGSQRVGGNSMPCPVELLSTCWPSSRRWPRHCGCTARPGSEALPWLAVAIMAAAAVAVCTIASNRELRCRHTAHPPRSFAPMARVASFMRRPVYTVSSVALEPLESIRLASPP